jgi:hypothetical protein
LGNTEVFNSISIAPNRRAISFTAEETGSIESISIYHDGGTGNVLLGVYSDDNGSPSYQLGVSSSTTINSTPGWQTVLLPSALPVTAGQTIWLAWVFQNNPGIRYTVSSNGRVQSIDSWSEGMPTNFGSFTTSNYEYSIYCTIKPSLTSIAGNNEVYEQSSIETFMRASSVTFDEGGTINSISIYHDGGTGNVLLGVYSDQSGSPASRLGVTASTAINSKEGWQTVSLQNPVTVYSGQTIWLSWVFQDHPGVRYSIGKPGRAQSTGTWPAGMPTNFGSSSFSDYNYSIYCSFIPNKPILKGAEIPEFVDSDPVITPDATFIEPKPNTKVNSFNEKNMTQFNDFDFKMYPNPAKSHVNIDFVFFPETGTTIEIIDGFGRIIEKKPAESTSNRIETNQLTRGMYFIKVINNQNYLVKKLIIE